MFHAQVVDGTIGVYRGGFHVFSFLVLSGAESVHKLTPSVLERDEPMLVKSGRCSV
jgi:hypothetical protein